MSPRWFFRPRIAGRRDARSFVPRGIDHQILRDVDGLPTTITDVHHDGVQLWHDVNVSALWAIGFQYSIFPILGRRSRNPNRNLPVFDVLKQVLQGFDRRITECGDAFLEIWTHQCTTLSPSHMSRIERVRMSSMRLNRRLWARTTFYRGFHGTWRRPGLEEETPATPN
jgi:hypothetical protein